MSVERIEKIRAEITEMLEKVLDQNPDDLSFISVGIGTLKQEVPTVGFILHKGTVTCLSAVSLLELSDSLEKEAIKTIMQELFKVNKQLNSANEELAKITLGNTDFKNGEEGTVAQGTAK